jgi:hypothetical protein
MLEKHTPEDVCSADVVALLLLLGTVYAVLLKGWKLQVVQQVKKPGHDPV